VHGKRRKYPHTKIGRENIYSTGLSSEIEKTTVYIHVNTTADRGRNIS
jgi:hypothetical protein